VNPARARDAPRRCISKNTCDERRSAPVAVIDKVYRDTAKALEAADLRKRFDDLGMAPVGNPPADFATAIREESGRWAKVIRARKLEVN